MVAVASGASASPDRLARVKLRFHQTRRAAAARDPIRDESRAEKAPKGQNETRGFASREKKRREARAYA
jgi:hypothetical protein